MEFKLTKTFLSKRPSQSNSLFIATMCLAFLLLLFVVNQKYLIANGDLVFGQGEYWRAWTSALLHGDLNHLAHNAFFFTGLAMLLNHYFGFWVFPMVSFLVGGLINIVCLYFYPSHVNLVGVSGIVYFMASFWLTLYLLIEKRQSVFVRLVHAMAVSLIFLFPETFDPQTSYLAHGVGFLFGVPLALAYYFMNRKTILKHEVWVPVEKEYDEMENIILLDESSYRQVESEDVAPSQRASDCAQCQQH